MTVTGLAETDGDSVEDWPPLCDADEFEGELSRDIRDMAESLKAEGWIWRFRVCRTDIDLDMVIWRPVHS